MYQNLPQGAMIPSQFQPLTVLTTYLPKIYLNVTFPLDLLLGLPSCRFPRRKQVWNWISLYLSIL